MQNLGKERKFFLKVSNVADMHELQNKFDYYKNPYQVMADLEKRIEFNSRIEKRILIPYKEDGVAVFDLIERDGKVLNYKFSHLAS